MPAVAAPQAPQGPDTHHEAISEHTDFKPKGQEELLDLNACIGSDGPHPATSRKNKRKDESPTASLCAWLVDHQIGLSINLVLLLALAHICFPRARSRTRKFVELSYYDPATKKYAQGWDDLCLVAFWIVAFTGLRAAIMDYVLIPFGRWGGIKKRKATVRFAEQAWLFLYGGISWSLGMYIMYHSDYWFNPREMWTHFPAREMDGLLKWYYLVQFAFWLQQIIVVNIEERRKDYEQMLFHHIITCALILFSYGFYQSRVGNAILCCMDVGDPILAAAKMLRYLGFQMACDIAFGVFVVTWVITRHVLFLMICWSVHKDLPAAVPAGCYSSTTGDRLSDDGGSAILSNLLQPFCEPGGVVCFNERIWLTFLGLLLLLQCVLLLWLAMIIRVVIKVISGKPADDSRSDDEGDEEIEPVPPESNQPRPKAALSSRSARAAMTLPPDREHAATPDEFTAQAQSIAVTPMRVNGTMPATASSAQPGRRTSNGRMSTPKSSRSSGFSLAEHGRPRKELLGRIGCDKPT